MTINDKYDFLHEIVGVSKDALDLFFGINGFNDKSAANILWYFTGYDDFDIYMEEINI